MLITSSITALITSIIVTIFLPILFKKWIKSFFDKKLENHKHNLELVTRQIDHDYQRRLHDFNLYATKVHEVYAMLYSYFAEAKTSTDIATSLFRQYPDFTQFSEQRLVDYLKEKQADSKRIDDILFHFQNKHLLALMVQGHTDLVAISEADKLKVKAIRYWYQSELYLSEEASKLLNTISDSLQSSLVDERMLAFDKLNGKNPRYENISNFEETRKSITNDLIKLKETMQLEISGGYYQKLIEEE